MDIWGQSNIGGLSNEQLALLVLVQVWDLIWKGFALWRAARNKDIFWFVLLILVNSAGLLPAVYLFYLSKNPKKKMLRIKLHKTNTDKKEEKSSKEKQEKTK